MNSRQREEFAKLCLDIGKLVIASLVLGFFQSDLPSTIILAYGIVGLTFGIFFFILGLNLLKD